MFENLSFGAKTNLMWAATWTLGIMAVVLLIFVPISMHVIWPAFIGGPVAGIAVFLGMQADDRKG